jgi:hypothetical protein
MARPRTLAAGSRAAIGAIRCAAWGAMGSIFPSVTDGWRGRPVAASVSRSVFSTNIRLKEFIMRAAHWFSGLGHRFRSINPARRHRRQRRANHAAPLAAEVSHLEARCLLSGGVPIPGTNVRVDLKTIFWNGGPPINTTDGLDNIPSPTTDHAEKSITISNDGPDMIYPFLRGQNSGQDPNSTGPTQFYDPQDLMDHEFREYIGYTAPDGKDYLGLPPGASITVTVPLVLWDGDNLYIATDGKDLTSPTLFGYDANASITIAKTDKIDGTVWVQGSKGYAGGDTPLVMFYYSGGAPITLPNDAPAQLTEVTFRDQYLTHFITDPAQTFPLVNYDVSYVNNLVAPVSMEASHVPITYGINPPTYYGSEDFGWLATDRHTDTFEEAIGDFFNNQKPASLGQYFGGKGWPEYYNPDKDHHQIPSGANLFANSPLNKGTGLVHTSTYDPNHWLLTSDGRAPIQAGGAGVGVQGFVSADTPNRIYLNNLPKSFVADLTDMMKDGVVDVSYPGSPDVLATVLDYHPDPGGKPYVTVSTNLPPNDPSGAVYAFTRTASDYAVTDITNLWYSWAQYYVDQYQDFQPETVQGTLVFKNGQYATNEIVLASNPSTSLAVGMTVTAPSGVPAGTTILSITENAQGTDDIYLSQIPADNTPAVQAYTFSKPQAIPYQSETTPYPIEFDAADTPNAVLFAGSVYEAMSAEAGVNPLPFSYLPDAMNLVSQVIQFYAKLPGYDRPDATGSDLVGQVRDVVKSILRGVYNFNVITDQSQWYPDPSTPPTGLLSGQDFNVFNLDPYVWFVHKVEGMAAYGFSVDDDVSNPTATGPLVAADGTPNHEPSNLQIDFGGTKSLGNKSQWFPTIPWGALPSDTTKFQATISVFNDPTSPYNGDSIVTFTGKDALKAYNMINNPGTGQVGATISAPGYIAPGTTLIFKGPTSGTIPQIVLSKPALKFTDTPVDVKITAEA